ncbi:THO complex subunit 1 transcription elongation factor-domain-containing protein [Papiliotrema laurentii]|uniref:THO complex subunit 1 transcription elongation factor-domain-containing protein n=1 Tax=Papiliotrema laurentii TaxID=5418 RepID=A0AAD9CXA6_PAPLA|nr:THO complex subunit 1 transcription elongation factor-domain-containing protein [Papiliotrema laurentii]
MSTIQEALTEGLGPIIAPIPNLTSSSSSSKGKAKSSSTDISAIWARLDLPQIATPPAPLPKDASPEAKAARREEDRIRETPVDLIRGVLEVVGKDIVLGPLLSGELVDPPRDAAESVKAQFQTQLQARLDVVLALYEAAGASYPDIPSLDAGYNFVPLLEDLVELLSIDTWRELWSYVETRAPRYTKGMLPSRGKALSLLRILNTFTRFLPRTPEDIAFKGRVWQFASRTIGITDRSAVNFRGEFNHYKTTWEQEPSAPATEADGDVKMDDEGVKAEVPKDGIDSELYSTLWSLQEYFAFPPLLAQKSKQRRPFDHLEHFKTKTDAVLPKLFAETDKERDALVKEKEDGHERKRKRGDDATGGFFHPRYLTERRLFEYELKDASFRRQILTQYFILFQFLLNLTSESKGKQAYTGGMPKDFELKEEDIRWIKDKIKAIRGDLVKMPGDGPRFDSILLSIIGHEHFYAAWKNEACAEAYFEVPQAEQPEFERKIYTLPEQRLQPLNVKYYQPGSKPMPIPVTAVTIEEQGEDDDVDLPQWQRMTKRMRKLQEDMADDEAMGQLEAAKKKAYEEKIEDLNYRAMRLARQVVDWRHFEANADKSSVLALEDTVKAAETADTPVLTTTDRFQDEAVSWLPAPPEEAEPAETMMEVDEQAK